MGTYTTSQYAKKLEAIYGKLQDQKPHLEIVSEVIRRQQSRIFDKSVDGDGKKLAKYSIKPIYVNPKKSPRKTPVKTFKNGKARKTTYFPGGYAQYKKAIGKGGGGTVNLWLFGSFRKAFMNSLGSALKTSNSQRISIRTRIIPGVQNPEGKIDGILDRYGIAFKLTKGERGYIVKANRDLLMDLFNE